VLPAPQRRAVEAAFLRAEEPASPHAVAAGVLGILRAVSAGGPVLGGGMVAGCIPDDAYKHDPGPPQGPNYSPWPGMVTPCQSVSGCGNS
jgi:hypothetical protein